MIHGLELVEACSDFKVSVSCFGILSALLLEVARVGKELVECVLIDDTLVEVRLSICGFQHLLLHAGLLIGSSRRDLISLCELVVVFVDLPLELGVKDVVF